MLYLFDIDGTLVDTAGAGMAALIEATRAVFGEDGPPLDLAGSTDLGIVYGIHAHFQIEATQERIARFFEIYQHHLDLNLFEEKFPGRVLDGVTEILLELSSREHACIGLLTGNIASGAASKVRRFGLASYFAFGAYGSDHHDRNLLGPIALDRAFQSSGRTFEPQETWVIGDTPKDIACAQAMGAKCLAVATGQFTIAQLQPYGADRVIARLDEAMDWL